MDDPDATRPLQASEPAPRDAAPGTLLGRYVILDRLGEGGGGEVFVSFDPVLDRKVAVKRLHGDGRNAEALVREARILARLNHPHVVTVHDVGIEDDRAYLAMELVDGSDLAHATREDPTRSAAQHWRTTRQRLLDAGEGLAAAHGQGIIHGDIKPANILVGRDGRVRVSDFGVARLAQPQGDSGDDPDPLRPGAGTPRYMAPEQHDGAPPDERSDVYSFCLTAWESLFGVMPFATGDRGGPTMAGTTAESDAELYTPGASGVVALAELRSAKLAGRPDPPSEARGVPARIVDALRRGLDPEPSLRFASMRDLLAVLAWDPARRRRRVLSLAAGGLVVASAAAAAGAWRSHADLRCTGATAELTGIWDPDRRAEIEAATIGAAPDGQTETATWLVDNLDAYADEWAAMHRDNCEATRIRAEQSEGDMDLRLRCLLRARTQLDATVDVLATADTAVVQRAREIVTQLPAVQRCGDVLTLESDALVPGDPELARKVEDVRERFARGTALERAGRYREALAIVEPLAAEAEALAFAPLLAEIGAVQGFVLERNGRSEDAERVWRRAVEIAVEEGPRGAGARAAGMLVSHMSDMDARFGEADVYARIAVSLARHAGRGTADEAYALNRRGGLRIEQNRYEEAERDHAEALAIWERIHGPDHPEVALALTSLGRLHDNRHEHDEAEAIYRRSLGIFERAFGSENAEVAISLSNIGHVQQARGEYEEAKALYERALGILERVLGPAHIEVSAVLTNLGVVENSLGRREQAEALYRRALAIVEKEHGPDHVEGGRVLVNIGVIELYGSRFAEAEATFSRALAILEPLLGEAHPHVAMGITNLAIALSAQERFGEAEEVFARVLAIRERTLPAGDPGIASVLGNLGELKLAQARPEDAAADFERSLSIRQAHESAPKDLAFDNFGLARATWELGQKERARELAGQALKAYEAAGEGYVDRRDQVSTWIAEHAG